MLRRIVTAAIAFPEWLFGPRFAFIDGALAGLAAGWATLMINRPHQFDRGSFIGMSWMPDEAWIALMIGIAILHTVALVFPIRGLRVGTALVSAWAWIFVTVSFARVEVGTGVPAYAIYGGLALFGSIFLAGQSRVRR